MRNVRWFWIALALACIFVYDFTWYGEVWVEPPAKAVVALKFPRNTFRYARPFFFEASNPAALYVSNAPPSAMPAGETAWAISAPGDGVHIEPIEGVVLRDRFRPAPEFSMRGPGGESAGADEPCRADGARLGDLSLPGEGDSVALRFQGAHFTRYGIGLFRWAGGARGWRRNDVFFGYRSIVVCRHGLPRVWLRQWLWNAQSASVPDLVFADPKRRLILMTGEAETRDTILALPY